MIVFSEPLPLATPSTAMPYQQALSVNAEQILVPQVGRIHLHQ
jgi:hypothetical protein